MKMYKVYANSKGKNEAVKIGWSWSAFFFTWMWALGKQIWRLTTLTTGVFIMTLVVSFIAVAIIPEFASKLSFEFLLIYTGYFVIGFSILMGFNGNQWYENKLLTRGYRFRAFIVADNSKEAVTSYTQKNDDQYLMAA